ncbi:uncharacterized protein [Montipora foliosa]|uniref:uncharacterized protein n=1 Tax=Montipora foliosa TaxID=591990 RepID=UPI0035F18A1A
MAVFQELTSEKLPSSSEHFPLLAMYYSVSIMEIGTALGATCIILNFHHRNTRMPKWFHKIVLEWIAKLVRYIIENKGRKLATILKILLILAVPPSNLTRELTILSKFLHMQYRLEQKKKKFNILADFQHGCRNGRSCETQLATTLEDIALNMDSGI